MAKENPRPQQNQVSQAVKALRDIDTSTLPEDAAAAVEAAIAALEPISANFGGGDGP